MRNQSVGLLSIVVIAACGAESATVPPITPAMVEKAKALSPSVTQASIENGRSVYVGPCTGCHESKRIANFSKDQWPGIIKAMSTRAKLTEEQKTDVLNFVLAAKALEQ